MAITNVIKKLGYEYLTENYGVKIYKNNNGKASYLIFQNDYPMLLLSKLKEKFIIYNRFFDFKEKQEYNGDILEPTSFKRIGRISFYVSNEKKIIIEKVEGKINFTWNLIDLHAPLNIDPTKGFIDLLKSFGPTLVGLANIYTDPLSLNLLSSHSYFLPPLIYGYSRQDLINNFYNGLKIKIKYNNNPIYYSFPENNELSAAINIIKKIVDIGF
ncbi:hypothetical protein [Caldisphaera sp.]|uniref:hypothetical protein n=1 Tax=Caldisphaera sp. TaxID=2060322 RepID=UPI0025B8A0E1|nr:hypothetical protein [Caldisphaera sp.]